MDVTSTTDEKVVITLDPKTASGKPATVDGKPIWEILTGNASLDVADDGLSAFLVSEDVMGSSTWRVKADADLGEGVKTIEDGGTYTYTNAEAAALGITAGAAVPK